MERQDGNNMDPIARKLFLSIEIGNVTATSSAKRVQSYELSMIQSSSDLYLVENVIWLGGDSIVFCIGNTLKKHA